MYMGVHKWRPEVNIGSPLILLSATFFFKMGSLTEPKVQVTLWATGASQLSAQQSACLHPTAWGLQISGSYHAHLLCGS